MQRPHQDEKRGTAIQISKNVLAALGKRSDLSIPNKLLLYKQVLRPIWTYGIQLWRCAEKSNIELIQYYQNRVLRSIE